MAIGAIIGGIGSLIGAGSSLFGPKRSSSSSGSRAVDISGYQAAADSYNRQAQDIYNQQKAFAERQAAIQNAYQTQQFLGGLTDYTDQYNYQWDLSVSDYQNQVAIQDYEALVQQKLYQKSLGIASSQLNLNDLSQDLAFATEDFNLKNLMKQTMFSQESELIALQNAVTENQLNTKTSGLALAGVGQQQELLGIQKGELGLKAGELGLQLEELGIKKSDLAISGKSLGLKSADIAVKGKELDLQRDQLGLSIQGLALQKLGIARDEQFIGQEEILLEQKNAIAQQFIQNELTESKRQATFEKQGAYVETLNKQGTVLTQQAGKSRGKAEQVVLGEFFRGMAQLESTLTGQNRQAALRLKELQTKTSFDRASLQLKRDKLGLQEQGLTMDQQRIAMQAQGLGLNQQQLALQARGVDLEQMQLLNQMRGVNLQQQGVGLQGQALGFAGQRLDVQGQQLGLEAAQIGLQQERYDVALQNSITDTTFNMKVIDAEVMQAAEQATMNKKNISIQKFGADLNAVANMMIKPSSLPVPPPPTKLPEQTFIEPPKIEAQYIAPPINKTAYDFGYRPTAASSGGGGGGGGTSAGSILGAVGAGLGAVGAIYSGFGGLGGSKSSGGDSNKTTYQGSQTGGTGLKFDEKTFSGGQTFNYTPGYKSTTQSMYGA